MKIGQRRNTIRLTSSLSLYMSTCHRFTPNSFRDATLDEQHLKLGISRAHRSSEFWSMILYLLAAMKYYQYLPQILCSCFGKIVSFAWNLAVRQSIRTVSVMALGASTSVYQLQLLFDARKTPKASWSNSSSLCLV